MFARRSAIEFRLGMKTPCVAPFDRDRFVEVIKMRNMRCGVIAPRRSPSRLFFLGGLLFMFSNIGIKESRVSAAENQYRFERFSLDDSLWHPVGGDEYGPSALGAGERSYRERTTLGGSG